ncbi:phospholipid carrier-dependent glycosyltransferase [candidate division KSB1 bacterium]
MATRKGGLGSLEQYRKYLTDKNVVIFLFIFALVLRIMFANGGIPHFDSIADANKAPLVLETGKMQYSYGYGSPGIVVLTTVVYALDHWTTGATNAEFAYFFITFITAALSISVLYLIVRKITKDQLTGFLAAIFFCVTPIYLSVTTYPKTHAPGVFFALLGGYYLLKAADGDKKELRCIIYSGLLFSFATTIRVFSFIYIIPFLLIYARPKISLGKKTSLSFNKAILDKKNMFWFIFSLFIVFFILFIPRFMEMGIGGFIKIILGEKGTVSVSRGFFESAKFSLSQLGISITWLGWIAIALGAYYLYKKSKLAFSSIALWFLIFFVFFSRMVSMEARFLIPALIPLIIFMACGTKLLYNSNKILGIAVAVVLVVWMFATIYPIIDYRHDHSGQKEFALWIAENTEPNALIMTNDEGFFMEFYTDRKRLTPPRPWEGQTVEGFMEQLHDYSDNGIPLYITSTGFAIDPGKQFSTALTNEFDLFLVGERENEHYSQNTLQFQKFNEQLVKVVPKTIANEAE